MLSLKCLFSVLSEITNRFWSLPDCCLRQFLCICFLQPFVCDPMLPWCPLTSQKHFTSSYRKSGKCKNWFDEMKGERRHSKFSLTFKNVFPRAAVRNCISAGPKLLQTRKSDLEIGKRWDPCVACWQRANFQPHYMVTPRCIRDQNPTQRYFPITVWLKVKMTCMTHTYPLKEIIEHYPIAVLTAQYNPPWRMLEVKSWPQSSHSDFLLLSPFVGFHHRTGG